MQQRFERFKYNEEVSITYERMKTSSSKKHDIELLLFLCYFLSLFLFTPFHFFIFQFFIIFPIFLFDFLLSIFLIFHIYFCLSFVAYFILAY
jgi:hypothetical protein